MNKLKTRRDKLSSYIRHAATADRFKRLASRVYYQDIQKFLRWLIPPWASVLELDSKNGDFETLRLKKTYDYVVLINVLSFVFDAQKFIGRLRRCSHNQSRIVVISFNFLWKPMLDMAEYVHLRTKMPFEPNWLTDYDIENLFLLEGFSLVKKQKRLLMPFHIPLVTDFVNTYVAKLPIVKSLCLTEVFIFQPKPTPDNYSVSVIIPARNEEGNIPNILNRIPHMGTKTEVIFIEGHSKDRTYATIQKEIVRYRGSIKARLYKQQGTGKRNAVELGLSKARNELIVILDADLTVDPGELPKFYQALASGHGELIIGCRLVYPMEKQAMRTLNYIGNKFFSIAFSYLLGQTIKDTLCGTKAFLMDTYRKIEANREQFGNFDPYGDFDLIFGASKLNLKIVEIPVRYKERTYGTSNISRFSHGLLLLRMTLFAAHKLKFI